MTDLAVVATPVTAVGFRLGGARTIVAADADETIAAVRAATEDGRAAVIAVHGALWSVVPPLIRNTWTRQTSPLVLSLPDEDGAAAAARDAELRDLLARAIGYQITFTPSGGTP
jgi:vacuolar-type H+-ATPase subunit F/Vma7